MKIILYTIHCPKCNVLEKQLEKKGVAYELVDDNDTVVQFGKSHNISSAPILAVDDKIMDFNEAIKWVRG